jgi:pilus assembly protein Flp/PilA
MRGFCRQLAAAFEAFDRDESAQDLIEYALLAAIVALGAVVSLNSVANQVNTAFSHVHSKLHSHIGKHLGWGK